jgi:methionyl-tRNA synthetase
MSRFYVTTPIYYVSDVPHIGHAYTTIVCDTLARYHRLRGDATSFLSGTDEHGQKIARMAEERGLPAKAYADKIAEAYRATWNALEISNDDFIRTTDADHEALVQELWKKLEATGDIYLGHYEGWYCVACEQFYTEKELVETNCPVHKKPVEKVREESWFLRL